MENEHEFKWLQRYFFAAVTPSRSATITVPTSVMASNNRQAATLLRAGSVSSIRLK